MEDLALNRFNAKQLYYGMNGTQKTMDSLCLLLGKKKREEDLKSLVNHVKDYAKFSSYVC